MKILTFSTLYPNNEQIRHGIFVEQRLRKLVQSSEIETRVVAPVPWFPLKADRFGHYSRFARVERRTSRYGIECVYPRYPVIPKVGMVPAPFLLTAWTYPVLRKLIAEGYDFDLIDAHYFYPDGVAAAMLGRLLGKPVIVTARGSDINTIPDYRTPRRLIQWAAARAAAVVAVSSALKNRMEGLGISREKIHVLRNGVDLDVFVPLSRTELKKKYIQKRPLLLSVGNLIELKGHNLVIEAMRSLPEFDLWIVGDGEQKAFLEKRAVDLNVAGQVFFKDPVSHSTLVEYYNIADMLVLASSREGLPNVLLEAMACGTPVIATNVGGIPEILTCDEAGVLMPERNSSEIVSAVRKLFEYPVIRQHTRLYVERFAWSNTVESLARLMQDQVTDSLG